MPDIIDPWASYEIIDGSNEWLIGGGGAATHGDATVSVRHHRASAETGFHLSLVYGSTTSAAGTWEFVLPITARSPNPRALEDPNWHLGRLVGVGWCEAYDLSADKPYGGPCEVYAERWVGGGVTHTTVKPSANNLWVTNLQPFTWAAGDRLEISAAGIEALDN